MDFQLSEEQVELQGTARDILQSRWPAAHPRQALDTPPGRVPPTLWSELAGLGWLGIASGEDVGGSGGDLVAAAVLAEEAGRALLPGPFLSTLVAGIVVDRAGDDRQRKALLPDLFSGAAFGTVAIEGEPDDVTAEPAMGAAPAEEASVDSVVLGGARLLVPDAEGSDWAIVAAGTELYCVPTELATVTPMRRWDAQAIAEVRLDSVVVPAESAVGNSAVTLAWDVGPLLAAADLLGCAQHCLEMTTQYAKDRTQFGRPIGSFQAVSHRLADVCLRVEVARSLVYGAALALETGAHDSSPLVSAAKAYASDTAVAAAEAALGLHGGIGFTWELDVHLYLRRARAGAVSWGTAEAHLDRVAAYLDTAYDDTVG